MTKYSRVFHKPLYEPNAVVQGRGFETRVESTAEQDELRLFVESRDMPNHSTQVVQHAETDGFACPLRFAGDDDTVAGHSDYLELCFDLAL